MKTHIYFTLALTSAMFLTSNAMACDDKSCEKAYLSSTHQYVANHGRQARSEHDERRAHAKNRERKDYALQYHLRRMSLFNK